MRDVIDSKEFGTQDQIAKRMGVSPAFISSLWKTGVGGRSIEAFAKLLGFKDADELRRAAYDWFRSQGPKVASRTSEPAVMAALADVRMLHPHISDAQIQSVMNRFADEAFADREQDYWYRTLMEEIRRDYIRETAKRGEAASRALDRRAQIKNRQGIFRTGHTLKREVDKQRIASELERPVEEPTPVEILPKPSHHKRRA